MSETFFTGITARPCGTEHLWRHSLNPNLNHWKERKWHALTLVAHHTRSFTDDVNILHITVGTFGWMSGWLLHRGTSNTFQEVPYLSHCTSSFVLSEWKLPWECSSYFWSGNERAKLWRMLLNIRSCGLPLISREICILKYLVNSIHIYSSCLSYN